MEEVVNTTQENLELTEGLAQESKVDESEIMAELNRLKSTNNRLLEESKRHKQKAIENGQKLLEAEGKKDELISSLRQELEEKQRVMQEHEQYLIRQKIASAVAEKAKKYGCDDWDHLMVLGNNDLIEYDQESGQVKGVDLFFEEALKNDRFKKFFVRQDKVKTVNTIPGSPDIIDWKKNPLPYLMKLKKEGRNADYNNAIRELEKDGLLK